MPIDPLYFASDMLKEVHQYRRQGVPTMRVSVLKTIFADYLKEGMVIVNVNESPHCTYLRMVRTFAPKFIIPKSIYYIVFSIY